MNIDEILEFQEETLSCKSENADSLRTEELDEYQVERFLKRVPLEEKKDIFKLQKKNIELEERIEDS